MSCLRVPHQENQIQKLGRVIQTRGAEASLNQVGAQREDRINQAAPGAAGPAARGAARPRGRGGPQCPHRPTSRRGHELVSRLTHEQMSELID